MRYQLSTGKTINISFEDWLNLDDLKIQEYISKDSGLDISDPFADIDFVEFKLKTFDIPEVDKHVELLDQEDVEKIKKEINESD